MTGWIVGSSLRLGRLVMAAAMAVLVLGTLQLSSASVDVLPEFTAPAVRVQTEALGLSAAEVESLVTVPLEQDLLNGVPWVDHISSQSVPGLSAIQLVFEPGTDVYGARQMVQERMTQIRVLPNVGTPPVMIQPEASASRVAMIGLGSQDAAKVSLVDLSVLARWQIRPRLMGIPGVANVEIYGQRDRQLQVHVDPARLAARKVALSSVISSTGNALWVSPLTFIRASTPGTGGFIESPNQRLAIQHILPITTPQELAQIPVKPARGGREVKLGDVSRVTVDHQPLIGDAVVAGRPSLVLVVQKFPGANTEQVTRAVEDAMVSMRPGLAGITVDTGMYRPATLIETGLRNLGYAGVLALLLLVVVLGFVVFSWRVAVVAIVTVPLSLVTAAWVLDLRGTTFTTMTLIGLAAAATVVVDDVVVGVDVVRRRLRARRESGEAVTVNAAVVEVCAQARIPLVYATLVALLVTVPALFLTPFAEAFSRPVVLSYALALLASMAVALVVTPTLALLLFRGEVADRISPLARAAQRSFDGGLAAVLDRPRYAAAGVALLVAGAGAVIPQLRSGDVLPRMQDPNVLVHLQSLPGTSLQEMDRVTTAVGRELRSIPAVADVGSHVGRAVTSDLTTDVSTSEVWVSLDPTADGAAAKAAVQRVVRGYPGIRSTTETYTAERLRQAAGETDSSLVVRVFGQDLPTLQRTAHQVQSAVQTVDGVGTTSVAPLVQQPAVQVTVKVAEAQRYGLDPGVIRRAATTMMSGLLVGNLYEKQAVFDVVVQGEGSAHASLTSLQHLQIDLPNAVGRHVQLSQVADVAIRPEPTVIRHEGVSRAVDVVITPAGRDAASLATDVATRVRALAMPLEYHAEVLGAGTAGSGGTGTAGFAVAAAVAVFLLLQALLRSWRLATVLFLVVPLACVGGVLVAPLVGGVQSVGALAGLVAVLALAVRQALVLYRRCQELDGAGTDARAAVSQATSERVFPVVLTALGTAAVLLPVVLLGGRPGVEVLVPLAGTVLGGLVTSTLVVLLLLPALYLAVAGRRPGTSRVPRQAKTEDQGQPAAATSASDELLR